MIASWLLSPLRGGLLLALLLWLTWRWLPRLLRTVGIVGLLLCLLLTTPLGANALVRWQEGRATDAGQCVDPMPTTIVLLGGGVQTATDDPANYAVLSASSLRRTFAAAALARQRPEAPIVVTGDSYSGISESVLMSRLLVELGIDESRIRREEHARTTWQNARFSAALQTPVDRHIWLVTSALHMHRSLHAFAESGFSACPWPSDSRYAEWIGWGYLLPGSSALQKAEAALHEIAGEWAYRIGWLRGEDRNPAPASGER